MAKKDELKAILEQVEAEFGEILKSEQEKLAKAATGQDDGDGDEPAAVGDEQSSPNEAAQSDAAETSPAEETSPEASAEGSPEGSPEASAEGSADPAAGGPADPAALEAEYAKLPPEELKMHYLAAKAALFKLMSAGPEASPAGPGAGPGPGPEASAPVGPPAGGPPVGPEDSAPVPPPMGKKELSINKEANGGKIVKKSEDSAELTKSEKQELFALREQVELLVKGLENLASPSRKAVTSVDFVQKTETTQAPKALTKGEVVEKLKVVTANPELKKSDRELINSYFAGAVDLSKIEHLLK